MKNKPSDNYLFREGSLHASEPNVLESSQLKAGENIINIGPQHPSTHGVLRFEILAEGEVVKKVVPHLGYLHRCFEKHAEALPYNQIIPYVDRLDYLAAINAEHCYAMAVEKMLGIEGTLHPRVEYIRVLVAELNRIGSHFVAIGAYGIDIGATTPFLWLLRDREHILRMLEWISGARMLYNYIWIGGLYYDLPVGFEQRCQEFMLYLKPKLAETDTLLLQNPIFINRTANVGTLPLDVAINYGVTGPMLRASGLAFDLRRVDGYSVYPDLEFDIPVGSGAMGSVGDCWDRTWVRMEECRQSIRIIEQCLVRLSTDLKRTPSFNPQANCPKKIRPAAGQQYFRAENPRGELGFDITADGKRDVPTRIKVRSSGFSNLSVMEELANNCLLADTIAIIGSIDFVMGEVDK